MTYQEMLFGFFDISDSVSQTVTSASLAVFSCWCPGSFGLTVISTGEAMIIAPGQEKPEVCISGSTLPSYTCLLIIVAVRAVESCWVHFSRKTIA